MGVRDEMRDPWTYIVGGFMGGLAWAVAGVPIAAAAAIGAAVAGVKVVAASALGGGRGQAPPLPVTGKSPEDTWLKRAQRAVSSFDRLASSAPAGAVSERGRTIVEQARSTLDGLRTLAGQASTTREVGSHLDPAALRRERTRLEAALNGERDEDLRAELQRSLEAVKEQLEIADRLDSSLAMLLARMESGTLGLERLVAQLAEVLALSETATSPVEGAAQLDSLADELEGIRSGLSETERLSRRALGAYGGEGVPSDEPGKGSA